MVDDEVEYRVQEAVDTGELNLSSRGLTIVPRCVTSCGGLVSLDLSANAVEALPDNLGDLHLLSDLDVSFNKLRGFPATLSKCQRLVRINAAYNQLSQLGTEFASLGSLQSLTLHDNKLSCLPALMGSLSSLCDLHLQYNQLEELPLELAQLPELQVLALEGNPMREASLLSLPSSRVDAEAIDRNALLAALQRQPGVHKGRAGDAPVSGAAAVDASPQADVLTLDEGPSSDAAPRGSAAHDAVLQLGCAGDDADADADFRAAVVRAEQDAARGGGASGGADTGGEGREGDGAGVAGTSAADAMLAEVMDLPPAAAAVMYRTYDAVRTGTAEVAAGRPLSRGGTASSAAAGAAGGAHCGPQAMARLLTAAGSNRPGSAAARAALGASPSSVARPGSAGRAGLASASGRRPGSGAALPPRTASGGSATPGGSPSGKASAVLAAQSPPSQARRAGSQGSGMDALPPLTFPLTSGMRSMLRRMTSAKDGAETPPAPAPTPPPEAAAAATSGAAGAQRPERHAGAALWNGANAGAHGHSGGSHEAGTSGATWDPDASWGSGVEPSGPDAADLDMVRQLLVSRNPTLLATLDDALAAEPDD